MALTGLGDRERATLAGPALAAGWLAVAVAAFPALAGVDLSPTVRYAPLVASALLFGMPHGAIDYVALPRAVAGEVTPRWLAVVGAVYLVLGGAYAAAWFAVPVAAALAFVAVTWLHWGQGDLYPLLAFLDVDYLDTRTRRAGTLLVRGGLPMLVPLLAFPAVYLDVAGWVVGAIDADIAMGSSVAPGVAVGAAVAFAALCLVHVLAGWRAAPRDGRRGWAIDAGETVLLALFFATVHPLLAIGLYFCLWHSLRHIVRLTEVPGYVPATAGRPWRAFAFHAAPTTALALLFLAGLYALVPVTPASLDDAIGLYLVLIAVLTLPHVWVVLRMDRAENVWAAADTKPTAAR